MFLARASLVAFAVSLAAGAVAEEEQPLWEVGAVAGGGLLPDYPAADEAHARGIAVPYAIYRGEVFRLGDRGAARGIVTDQERIEIDVGIDAAFPVDSDENDAREGMNDLDFLLEVGPRVTYRFLPDDEVNELDASLALRAVISTDFANWRYQGITLNPVLAYRRNDLFGLDMRGVATLSPLFGLDGINDYFYRVAPAEERLGRPAFETDPGYIGSELSLGISWDILDSLRIFGGVQIGYWAGSANDDSPLHRDNTTLGIGGGLRWTAFTSKRTVKR